MTQIKRQHVSKDGNIRTCNAKHEEDCRAEGALGHYDTKEEAQAAYEAHMESQNVKMTLKKPNFESLERRKNSILANVHKDRTRENDETYKSLRNWNIKQGFSDDELQYKTDIDYSFEKETQFIINNVRSHKGGFYEYYGGDRFDTLTRYGTLKDVLEEAKDTDYYSRTDLENMEDQVNELGTQLIASATRNNLFQHPDRAGEYYDHTIEALNEMDIYHSPETKSKVYKNLIQAKKMYEFYNFPEKLTYDGSDDDIRVHEKILAEGKKFSRESISKGELYIARYNTRKNLKEELSYIEDALHDIEGAIHHTRKLHDYTEKKTGRNKEKRRENLHNEEKLLQLQEKLYEIKKEQVGFRVSEHEGEIKRVPFFASKSTKEQIMFVNSKVQAQKEELQMKFDTANRYYQFASSERKTFSEELPHRINGGVFL